MRTSRKLLLATIVFLILAYPWLPFRIWDPVASFAIAGWFIFLIIERLRKPPQRKSMWQRVEWIGLGLLILVLGALLIPDKLPIVGWLFYGCTGVYLMFRGIR